MPLTAIQKRVADILKPFRTDSHYVAGGAVALEPNPVPSRHAGMILHGNQPGRIRSIPFDMDGPVIPETTYFDQQVG